MIVDWKCIGLLDTAQNGQIFSNMTQNQEWLKKIFLKHICETSIVPTYGLSLSSNFHSLQIYAR